MKCTIPEISWHNRDPVLSVDLQAKNKNESFQRLATGGTDAHVVIWHIEVQATGAASVEFAADLQRHQRAVNVVRFSPSGEFLASGDDESVIIIWKQKTDQDLPEMPTTDSEGNKEQWICLKVLRGHVEDVYDLSWSPDSINLISGSVDNSAILWDAQKGRNLGILKDHKGFVQGVAWDPLNKYVATLSSDRTCRIYNIKTKKIVSRISKAQLPVSESSELHGKVVRLFHDDTLKSFFRRLCFSPDGQLLIAPSGIVENANSDKHGNATHIFTRRVLNRPSAYLPSNNQYTVAVRCCPVLFELRNRNSVFALPYRVVLAVATQKSILLYDTQQPEPFGIVSNIHYTRLTDLTWSQDGRMLIVSSTDGYCSIITFAEGELGEIYKSKESSSAENVTSTPSSEDSNVLRTKEINSNAASEALQSSKVVVDKTRVMPLSGKNVANKSENQEKTPEKTEVIDLVCSPVTPKDIERVALNETPRHIKSVSATNSPNSITDSPKCSASPFQKTPKRIKPIFISKCTKSSPKSGEQTLKKPETLNIEMANSAIDLKEHPAASSKSPVKANTESSDHKQTINEHEQENAPSTSDVKPAAEKMEVDNVLPQRSVDSSSAVDSPTKKETNINVSTPKQRTPRRVQLITLSTTVSSKTILETKKVTEKNTTLVSGPNNSSVRESEVSEKMEIDLSDAQKHDSSSVEMNSKQEASKPMQSNNNSKKQTNSLSSQEKCVKAETECMETDEPEDLPESKVKDEETIHRKLNEPSEDTKPSEQKEKLEQTSETVVVDSETSVVHKDAKVSSVDISPCKEVEEKITQEGKVSNECSQDAKASSVDFSPCKEVEEKITQEDKASNECLQGSSTPSRKTAACFTPSNSNTTPNSPLRSELRSSSVTPGQEKRTPRRVQLITLSSPKSKKKLL